MSWISSSPYSDMDKSILCDELLRLKEEVKSYDKSTPFYVYSICDPTGMPLYVGKGKNTRVFDHIKAYSLHGRVDTNLFTKLLKKLGFEPPIMFIIKGNLNQSDALALESSEVAYFGRISDGGILANIMPGGNAYSHIEACSAGGKLGGRTTRDNNLGIFSPSYDRGAQSRKNFAEGLMDNIDFVAIGKIAGRASVDSQKGIHDPLNKDKRSEWAKIGAEALNLSGNRSGICSKKWREDNPEAIRLSNLKNAENFKVQGLITGSMPWWTNGILNKRSYTRPGEFWSPGMTKNKQSRYTCVHCGITLAKGQITQRHNDKCRLK